MSNIDLHAIIERWLGVHNTCQTGYSTIDCRNRILKINAV